MTHDATSPPAVSAAAGNAGTADVAEELARLRREIADRDDILALAAHELRNPLHALALHLALARATAQAGAGADAAERIRRAEQTLRRYTERVTVMMELLASPRAAYPLALQPVHVVTLLETLADSLEQEARSRHIDVRVVDDTGDAGRVRVVDAIALEQIVDNLLLNAFKHSGGSAVVLRVRTAADAWTVQVEDNGHGIALADQREIFDKFGVASHSSRGAGTGLGLWIVTRLVQALGAEIALASAPGEGCIFTIRIPENEASTSR